MNDLFNKLVNFGLGLATISREKVEAIVEELVKRGNLTRDEGAQAVQEILRKGQETRAGMNESIDDYVRQALKRLDVPTRAEIQALEARIMALEQRIGGPKPPF